MNAVSISEKYKMVARIDFDDTHIRTSQVMRSPMFETSYPVGKLSYPPIKDTPLFCYNSYTEAYENKGGTIWVGSSAEIWKVTALGVYQPHWIPQASYPPEVHQEFWQYLSGAVTRVEIEEAIALFKDATRCMLMMPPKGTVFCRAIRLDEIIWAQRVADDYQPANYKEPAKW